MNVGRPVRTSWSAQAAFIAMGMREFGVRQKILMGTKVRVQWNGRQFLAVPIGRDRNGNWRVRVLRSVSRGVPGTILTVPSTGIVEFVTGPVAEPKQDITMVETKPLKFPFLESLAKTIDQVGFDMEAEARKLVEQQVPAIQAKQKAVMDKARTRFGERSTALDNLSDLLDKVNESLGDNSSDRPTSEN